MSPTSEALESRRPATLRLRVARIRELADQRGFGTVAQMAAEFDLNRQHMYDLLSGKYLPSLPTAQRMASKLGIAVEDLYDRDGES